MKKWKLIASAPKDGTRLLLYQPDEGGSIIGKEEEEEVGYIFVGCWDSDYWYCTEYIAFSKEPTHWMELPEPPIGELQ